MGITCETHVIFMCFFREGNDERNKLSYFISVTLEI